MDSSELQVDSRWTPENSVVIWLILWNPSGLHLESAKSTRTTWSMWSKVKYCLHALTVSSSLPSWILSYESLMRDMCRILQGRRIWLSWLQVSCQSRLGLYFFHRPSCSIYFYYHTYAIDMGLLFIHKYHCEMLVEIWISLQSFTSCQTIDNSKIYSLLIWNMYIKIEQESMHVLLLTPLSAPNGEEQLINKLFFLSARDWTI